MATRLTLIQLGQLKADIVANTTTIDIGGVPTQVKNVPNNPDANQEIASQFYNMIALPSFFVKKTTLKVMDILNSPGFDYTRVDNLSVGKARIMEWMTGMWTPTSLINASQANVTAGINAAFSAAGDTATRLSIFVSCQRVAKNFEKLLSSGAGTPTDNAGVGPAILGVDLNGQPLEGVITGEDVTTARNLP